MAQRDLAQRDLATIAEIVRVRWTGGSAPSPMPAELSACRSLVLTLRIDGRRVLELWLQGRPLDRMLDECLAAARTRLPPEIMARVDLVELHCCGDSRLHADPVADEALHQNIARGLLGVEVAQANRAVRFSPSWALTTNRSITKTLELSIDAGSSVPATVQSFESRHLLLPLDPEQPAVQLVRGSHRVRPEDVDRAAMSRFVERASAWLANNLGPDGRMLYSYHPSTGEVSGANNMIRQWMATNALIRLATFFDNDAWMALARRNIEHNLGAHYRNHNGLGLILCDGKVKLGAVALAAMALHQHADKRQYTEVLNKLLRSVTTLWQEDGSFRTFLMPQGRNDNQNFYPGEALYLLAHLYRESKEPKLLDRIMQAFRYYRAWHLQPEARNPAFVPWHTQAYFMLWEDTGEDELKDFIFEMNDWLLGLQQDENSAPTADTIGRFYAPSKKYGPPHASSDGVYLEGLADAHALAIAVDDADRQRAYDGSIRLAFRSLIQLQFKDEMEAYYVASQKRQRVIGGVRTAVYDNRIRVDNVQHGLMGAMKYLARNPDVS